MHITTAELSEALPNVLAAPKDHAAVDTLCFRPGRNLREFPDELTLTTAQGVPGERWLSAPWLRQDDGAPHPGIQVSILPLRVLDLVWRDRKATPHPGDTVVADLDMSEVNLPEGSLIQAGTALLQVSNLFNEGCVKWKVRYGTDAKNWIVAPGHPELRLRGVLCAIVKDGVVRVGDQMKIIRRGK